MGSEHRWIKFWPQDWQRDPALRCCGVAARGLWIDLLCIMHEAEPYGHLVINGKAATNKQIGSITGIGEKEATKLLKELEDAGVFSRREDGMIFSRRMVRDQSASTEGSKRGKSGGNPDFIRGTVPKEERQRRYRPSDSPQKTKRIFDRSEGKCHWCGVQLTTEPGPTCFHVDHVTPIRDGGTNDEDNLVAACSVCNHKRNRHSGQTQTPAPNPTSTSDPNPTTTPQLMVGRFRPLSLEAEAEFKKQNPPMPPLFDLPGVVWREDDMGWHAVVGGYYLDVSWDRVAEIARLDPSRWTSPDQLVPLKRWLEEDIDLQTILAAIRRVVDRANYSPPFSLQFFDRAVREQPRMVA